MIQASPDSRTAHVPGTLGGVEQRADQQQVASFHAQIGGRPTFARLVERFYQGVATDPVLRPMYPEDDLEPAKQRLLMFLEQYWGGPTTYSELRGHPRLRARHARFRVDADARDRWLRHMRVAVSELHLAPAHESQLWDYLERAAWSMLNTVDG